MRLIEKKNDTVGVTVDNGALINYAAVGGQNGSFSEGFKITLNNGNVVASQGRLIVQGYTFEVNQASEVLFDLLGYAVADSDKRTLYLKVTFDATNRNSSYQFVVDKSSNYHENAQIQDGVNGDYYYPIATFSKSGSQILNFESQVKAIYIGTGQASAGTGGGVQGGSGLSIIPQPVIGVIDGKKVSRKTIGSAQHGYVVLTNAGEFRSLANSYNLKLIFYRRVANAKYRGGGTPYLRMRKTQWVQSEAVSPIGWNNLTTPGVIEGGSATGKKAITTVAAIVSRFFRDMSGHNVELGTTTGKVRATRAKVRKASGAQSSTGTFKHNFVEFAFKVKLYNISGSLVGESTMSNSIFIAPQDNDSRGDGKAQFLIKANH